MSNTYVLEVSNVYSFHSGMDFIINNFGREGLKSTIVTLNLIREAFGFKPIRAEYEMCFGPDTELPLDITASYNFSTHQYMESKNVPYLVKINNIVDLRHYYECENNGEEDK